MPMNLKKCTFPYGLVAIVLFFASTGLLGDKEIRVGRTPDNAVTDNLDGGTTGFHQSKWVGL